VEEGDDEELAGVDEVDEVERNVEEEV